MSAQEVAQQDPSGPSIYWYLSFRCNLACAHCWVSSSPIVPTDSDLTTRDALAVVQQLSELRPQVIMVTGGEPLLRRDFGEILMALTALDVEVSIETNAMLVTDRLVDAVREAPHHDRILFAVSLDGGRAEAHDRLRGQGSFERALLGLRRLRSAGLRCQVQCVANRTNIRTLRELAALVSPLAIERLIFTVPSPVGRARENSLAMTFEALPALIDEILKALAVHRGASIVKVPPALIPPRQMARLQMLAWRTARVHVATSCDFPVLGILPDGSVTICALTRADPRLRLGNVRETTLARIWRRQELQELRRHYLGAELTGVCGSCRFRTLCKGSCRAMAYREAEDFEAAHPTCAALDETGSFPPAYRMGAGPPAVSA